MPGRPRPPLLARVALSALACTTAAPVGAGQQIQSVLTAAGPVVVEQVAGGLRDPWGMAWLPDGRLLVTERIGNLRIVDADGRVSGRLPGTPSVYAQGQGGLLDVALHPRFEQNRLVYLSFAIPGPKDGAATALGRGRLAADRLEDFEVLFRQEPWIAGPNHFGGRIVFDGQGHVFLALGERYQFDPAQNLDNHLGKVVRLALDGSVPDDNPFAGRRDARPEIWSYGHRNIEAAALHPETGELWIGEMGPLGGDELNRVEAGRNYGWPVVSWGMDYDGSEIPDPPTRPEFADAVLQFTPVVSPSGMVFYTGERFAAWRGSAIMGGLSAHRLVRLEIVDGTVVAEERVPLPGRVRDVEQGPNGDLYVLNGPREGPGQLWRITPLR